MFWKHPWAWFKDTAVTFYMKGVNIAESFRYPPFIAFVLTVHTLLFPVTLLLGCIIKFCIDLRVRKYIDLEQTKEKIGMMDAGKMDEMITSLLREDYFSDASKDFKFKLNHGKKFDNMESIKLSIHKKFVREQLKEKLGEENASLVDICDWRSSTKFKLTQEKAQACDSECKAALEQKRSDNLTEQKTLFVEFLRNHGNFGKKMSQDIDRLVNEGSTPTLN